VAFYGGVIRNGTYEKVNEQLVHGIISGDRMGNFMLAVHIFLAAVITLGGPSNLPPPLESVSRFFTGGWDGCTLCRLL
jgi:hypothetical protein